MPVSAQTITAADVPGHGSRWGWIGADLRAKVINDPSMTLAETWIG
jgi:hypothetical protein